MIKDVWLYKLHDGWLGKLELSFSLKKRRSVLVKNSHLGPFMVQKSFYPEDDEMTPHVYLLHPPGGMVGGDQLRLLVNLEPGSRALLTTPSFSKFYRTNGKVAYQENFFRIKSNAVLEWIPQGNIFLPKSKARIHTTFQLDKGACMISFEILCFGSTNIIGVHEIPKKIDVSLYICKFGCVGLRDRLRVSDQQENCVNTQLGGFKISAFLFAIPANLMMLKQVQQLVRSIVDEQIGGATLLNTLLIVRLLGNDSHKLRKLLFRIWSIIRPVIIGKKAVIPRVWFT
ncbi:urease accessory protein ureD [Candidatus Blochmanniella vafra str. BVAF]|uniref:Urease accessory protein UreD n=1 Tax=Blochmanniella vafra (strain BVAF) TaxID=859654 RepID=E8Q6E0_BLOVB|nr:urease accessory protein UreD [Candidatus Blochmannia vafer]ADV33909.1 urease accessory protein ureD [Candidatus Blochmannia vafer str. BVAF]